MNGFHCTSVGSNCQSPGRFAYELRQSKPDENLQNCSSLMKSLGRLMAFKKCHLVRWNGVRQSWVVTYMFLNSILTHRIHVWYIRLHYFIWLYFYLIPSMDPMGKFQVKVWYLSIHWSFTPPSHCHHQEQGQQLPYSRQHHSRIKTTDQMQNIPRTQMTLVLTRKRLCFGGIDLQKLEVIFGSIGIYIQSKDTYTSIRLTSLHLGPLPSQPNNRKKHLNKKHIPTCISASTGASFLPPLAALRGAKGVNAAGFGVSGAAAARSGEVARGVATGGAGVPGMGVWGTGVAGIKRPGVDGAVPAGTGEEGPELIEKSFETLRKVDLVGHDAWKKKFQKDSPQMVGFWMGMNPICKIRKTWPQKQI